VLLTSCHVTTHGFPRQVSALGGCGTFRDGACARGQEACT
jgi:hypothetical protein